MKQIIKYNRFNSKSLKCKQSTGLSALIAFQIILLLCIPVQTNAQSGFEGDTDGNWIVNQVDLRTLMSRWLDTDCNEPNWCDGADLDQNNEVNVKDFTILAQNWLNGTDGNISIYHANNYPARLALGPNGKIYVSDPLVNSVFIYDNALTMIGEIKNLNKPLGVAVANDGRIYVGNDGRNNIEVYNSIGTKITTIAQGTVEMPTDMVLDRQGSLYVVDSLADTVRVYDSNGQWIRNIGDSGDGDGQLKFPVAVAISYHGNTDELFVADQGHAKIQVFDLQGNFQRAFGSKVRQGMTGYKWEGKFIRLQSLAVDINGRIHAADCYMNKIQILNAENGDYIDSYGSFGVSQGQLNLPLDITITDSGQVVVTNTENKRVEIIYTIP